MKYQYYKNHQKDDGSFDDLSIFNTALILCSDREKNIYSTRALDFILSEKDENWTWNYYKKEYRKEFNLPNDMDDTFTCLSAISIHKPEIITPKILSTIIKNLIKQEQKLGGPYYTWIVEPHMRDDWNNVDIGVNLNIALFLKLNHIDIPHGLQEYLDESILNKNFESEFYVNENLIIYFFSRIYEGKFKYLLEKVVTEKDKTNSIFIKCAKKYLGIDSNDDEIYVNSENLYIENIKNNNIKIVHSEALEHAIEKEIEILKKNDAYSKTREKNYRYIEEKLKEYSDQSDHPEIERRLDEVKNADKYGRIALMPYYIFDSLQYKQHIEKEILDTISKIAILGWFSYTIYDDIADKDCHANLLALANISHRLMLKKLYSLKIPSVENEVAVEKYLNTTDIHLFKITEEKPENKSLAYLLCPHLTMLFSGFEIHERETEIVLKFFRNILKVRQLLDDIHDQDIDNRNEIKNHIGNKDLYEIGTWIEDIITETKGLLEEIKIFCLVDYFKGFIVQIEESLNNKEKEFVTCYNKDNE